MKVWTLKIPCCDPDADMFREDRWLSWDSGKNFRAFFPGTDVSEAIQFARKQDAEAFKKFLWYWNYALVNRLEAVAESVPQGDGE